LLRKKKVYRRTALVQGAACELHPGDGLEVRHVGRTVFPPKLAAGARKRAGFSSLAARGTSRFCGDDAIVRSVN
jgi:hypothetical protein